MKLIPFTGKSKKLTKFAVYFGMTFTPTNRGVESMATGTVNLFAKNIESISAEDISAVQKLVIREFTPGKDHVFSAFRVIGVAIDGVDLLK